MNYQISIETASTSRPLAVVRRRVRPQEFAKVIPEACGIVWNALKAQNIKGAGRHVTVYLPDGSLEVGVELERPIENVAALGEVVASSLPTGSAAAAVHFGPYQHLRSAHDAIRDWCSRNGHALAGTHWEIYGHWLDEWNRDPSKIRTDVYYLLKQP